MFLPEFVDAHDVKQEVSWCWMAHLNCIGTYVSTTFRHTVYTQSTQPKTQHLSTRLLWNHGSSLRWDTGTSLWWASLLSRHVWPVDGASRELHVPDKRLNGRLTNQAHEEELRDEVGGNGSQGRQSQQESAEALRLTWILHALVLGQGHLCFLLQALDVRRIWQPTRVCRKQDKEFTTQLQVKWHIRYFLFEKDKLQRELWNLQTT